MPAPPSAELLYDACLLGLTYLREDRPHILARPGVSIFQGLRHAQVLTERQRLDLVKHYRLITLMMERSHIEYGDRSPSSQQLRALIATLDQHLIILVVPREQLQYARIVGPHGYLLVITEAGMEYARNVAPRYGQLLTAEKYRTAWKQYVHQVRGAKASRQQRGTLAGGGVRPGMPAAEPDIRLIEAKYSEDDFEW